MYDYLLKALLTLVCCFFSACIFLFIAGAILMSDEILELKDFLMLLATIASAVAAFLSWRSAEKSSKVAKDIFAFDKKLEAYSAVELIYAYLSRGGLSPTNDLFWLTDQEIKVFHENSLKINKNSFYFSDTLKNSLKKFSENLLIDVCDKQKGSQLHNEKPNEKEMRDARTKIYNESIKILTDIKNELTLY